MAAVHDDKQQSEIAPFAPIELPPPARLAEAAAATPDEQPYLDVKLDFFRYLDACVSDRVTATKEQYARDLADALAANNRMAEQAEALQRDLNAKDVIASDLARAMENQQEDLETYRLALRSTKRSLANLQAILQDMKELAEGESVGTPSGPNVIRGMDLLAKAMEDIDNILPGEKTCPKSTGQFAG